MSNDCASKTVLDESLSLYFVEARKKSRLDAEQEIALGRSAMEGDTEAIRALVEANLMLVVKIAKKYQNSDIPLIDLVQEGNMGLMKAATRYDGSRGVRFCTYASFWIKQGITRALENKRRTIRLPHRREEIVRRVIKAQDYLHQESGHNPSVEAIAREARVREKDAKEALQYSEPTVSIDCEFAEENTLHDVLQDNTWNPENMIIEKNMCNDVVKTLRNLMDIERKILMYRYAFVGGRRLTLKTIGSAMGLSPETVRQIEIKTIKKINTNSPELREYLYCS